MRPQEQAYDPPTTRPLRPSCGPIKTEPPAVPSAQPGETGKACSTNRPSRSSSGRVVRRVNHTTTRIGQAVLYRSLTCRRLRQPPYEKGRPRYGSWRKTRRCAKGGRVARGRKQREDGFYHLLFGRSSGWSVPRPTRWEFEGYGYTQYKKGTQFMFGTGFEAPMAAAAGQPVPARAGRRNPGFTASRRMR